VPGIHVFSGHDNGKATRAPTFLAAGGARWPMDFSLTAEQQAIRSAVEKICARFDDDYWLAKDRDGDPVFMARSAWDVSYQQEKNPELGFSATKER